MFKNFALAKVFFVNIFSKNNQQYKQASDFKQSFPT